MDSMTIYEIEQEIHNLVCFMLNEMDRTDHRLYALFMSRAYYDPLYMNLPLHVPYGTEEVYSGYVDETRLTFFCKYMNHYRQLPEWDNMNDESVVYEISMQLMIYSHIWESRSFMLLFIQMISILSKHEYKWMVNFSKNGKSNLIQQCILSLLDRVDNRIKEFVNYCYNADLRNCFAHSSYIIDVDKKEIQPLEPTHGYFIPDKSISFCEWDEKFFRLASFSYFLPKEINNRRMELIKELANDPILYRLPLDPNNPKGGSVEVWLGADFRRGFPEFKFYKKGV